MNRQIAALVIILTAVAIPAAAQERPAPAIELAGGVLMFADDGVVNEGFAGGAGRFYLSPRVSVGPEITFSAGREKIHVMATGNVTIDLADPGAAVTPFVVAGMGLFHTSETFPGGRNSTHNEGAFTAGGGLRANLGERVSAGAELRVGWELHVRANGFIGLRLGR